VRKIQTKRQKETFSVFLFPGYTCKLEAGIIIHLEERGEREKMGRERGERERETKRDKERQRETKREREIDKDNNCFYIISRIHLPIGRGNHHPA
jgi:hypothetical protein